MSSDYDNLFPAGVRNPGSAPDAVSDLAALGTVFASLSPASLRHGIEPALDCLRQAAGAEVAELFLAESQGRDMLLTAFSGPWRAAFSQLTRFRAGEGFPGLVENSGEPILTRRLPEDSRYLRVRVKEKGFCAYACVPLFGSEGVIGALNVASRRPDVDIMRMYRVISWAGIPFASVLESASLKARLDMMNRVNAEILSTSGDAEASLRAILRLLIRIGRADGGVLLLCDRNVRGLTKQIAEGDGDRLTCPEISLGNMESCPALSEEHGIVLHGPRHCRPSACRQASARSKMVYCLPLTGEAMQTGIVRLRYGADIPSPPTRYLAGLLDVAGQAAQVIGRIGKDSQDRVSVDFPVRVFREPESEPAQPFLEMRCFGAFELHREGKLIVPHMVKRRGAFTLLKILLLHGGRPVPRDVLEEILWPESAPGAAANRLHVLIHSLRTIVEPFPHKKQWVYVRSDGDRYYFNVDSPHRLDTVEFRELVSLGERLESSGDKARAVSAYEKAVQLYRGGLLEDEPYAEWCWAKREEFLETCLAVLGRLALFSFQEGAAESTIAWYRRALRLDPLRENNHQGLIRAFLASGRRDEAMRQYQACRDILRKELDVAPLPETEELYRAALRQ